MFAERFNYILRELKLQVGRLAGYAGLDRTNISRFKSGSRIPRPEGNTTSKLVHGIVLYKVKNSDPHDKDRSLISLYDAGIKQAWLHSASRQDPL